MESPDRAPGAGDETAAPSGGAAGTRASGGAGAADSPGGREAAGPSGGAEAAASPGSAGAVISAAGTEAPIRTDGPDRGPGRNTRPADSGGFSSPVASGGHSVEAGDRRRPADSGGFSSPVASGGHPVQADDRRPPVQRAVALSGLPPYEAGSPGNPPPAPAPLTRDPARGGARESRPAGSAPDPRPASEIPMPVPTSAPIAPDSPAAPGGVAAGSGTFASAETSAYSGPGGFSGTAAFSDAGEDDARRTHPPVAEPDEPRRSAGERFRPWLVPLVLVGVIAITAAAIGGNNPNGNGADDTHITAPGPPGTDVTIITVGPPSGAPSAAPSAAAAPGATPSSAAPGPATPGASAAAPTIAGPARTPVGGGGVTGRPNPTGANLALRRPITASSVESGTWPATAAVDGDEATRWGSEFQADPQWIRVDLGEVWSISGVEIVWERAFAQAFHVEVSVDGSTWTRVHDTTAGHEGLVSFSAGQTAGRYVRITGTARSTESDHQLYGYSILEWRIR
ncbi:discoidin domain-containing protein [Catenuloplanes indicus]|uniref:F5/8 type C domain-containing protein n=1 Tax=Catenuloplanes indicus TaxID=137267 RepID=A0AAE4B3F8_9ACTN|nr:discoidin domain-containing protein [Catenuloplanes indicus]MDQ0370068.1 hypothetical protein [Catenuloplanes indicus]